MNGELKTCPFCGGEAEVIEDEEPCYYGSSSVYRVECKKCPTSFGGWHFNNKQQAITAWNKRVTEAERK
jgi:Lar family restriction alleviation protein